MVHVTSTHVGQVINRTGALCFNAIGRAICSGCKYLRSTTGKQCSRCGSTKICRPVQEGDRIIGAEKVQPDMGPHTPPRQATGIPDSTEDDSPPTTQPTEQDPAGRMG
eukprot:8685147-Heterocapsa_arctica.AAC.1